MPTHSAAQPSLTIASAIQQSDIFLILKYFCNERCRMTALTRLNRDSTLDSITTPGIAVVLFHSKRVDISLKIGRERRRRMQKVIVEGFFKAKDSKALPGFRKE